jgi:cell division protein FtsN
MPTPDSTASGQRNRTRGPWHGYGLLAVPWLLLLGTGALAGWLVHTSDSGVRPVHTATLYSGVLPDPPTPPVAAAEETDPRMTQLAARDALTTIATDGRAADTEAAADPAPGRSERPQADTLPATDVPAIPGAIDSAEEDVPDVTAAPSANQLAARTDAPAAQAADAGPLPPPIPRSLVATASPWPETGSAARYSVQVGAFRVRENAVARAARLSEAGYEVRIVHALATHSRLYMVRLGAFDARPAAMAYARRVGRDVGFETWPVRN